MAGACRLFSGAHTAFSALLVHSEVSPGVSGPVFSALSAPPSLPPGKRAQGEGRAPESHPVFSAGNGLSFSRKLRV